MKIGKLNAIIWHITITDLFPSTCIILLAPLLRIIVGAHLLKIDDVNALADDSVGRPPPKTTFLLCRGTLF